MRIGKQRTYFLFRPRFLRLSAAFVSLFVSSNTWAQAPLEPAPTASNEASPSSPTPTATVNFGAASALQEGQSSENPNPSPENPTEEQLASGIPITPEQKSYIRNFYRHLRLLSDNLERRKDLEKQANVSPVPNAPKTYPFDHFSHLAAEDIVKAARQGAEEAREIYAGKSPEEIFRAARANAAFCYEFFPIVYKQPDDVSLVFYEIEDSQRDPAIRTYLIEQCVPGLASKSLFGDFFQEHAQRNRSELQRVLNKILQNYVEPARVREAAVQALYLCTYQQALEVLRDEVPLLQASIKAGQSLTPRFLAEHPEIGLSKNFQPTWEYILKTCTNIAQLCHALMQPTPYNPGFLRNTARKVLDRIEHDFPMLENQMLESLPAATLEGAPVAAPSPTEQDGAPTPSAQGVVPGAVNLPEDSIPRVENSIPEVPLPPTEQTSSSPTNP
jgi:hypothetical protein